MNETAETSGQHKSSLQSPQAHLAELAASKQLVLLGDQVGVAQHVRFVAESLPELYSAGVSNLAWEFTNQRSQKHLDELVFSDSWDENRCIELFVDLLGIGFTYREYADVLKAAWSLNRGLETDADPFRVIGLGLPTYVEDPELLEGRSAAELDLRNWWMGGHYRDIVAFHMASTLTSEVLRWEQRAVVLLSAESTTTRLIQWVDGVATVSVGNLLHRWMGEGVARVVFHGAVSDSGAIERVESLVAQAPEQPEQFGISLGLSTLGNVGVNEVIGTIDGIETSLRLRDIADSYIWLGNIESWEPCQLIDGVITDDNFSDLEARYRALDPRSEPWTAAELEEIREEGRLELSTSWPKLPAIEESSDKRRRFRKRRS
ncbi:MAG TPA: hypothetical protein QF409_10280 [Acidimicrobiales bacterium]|jgi:hypothetical protein|nr:hypothetical protein [Acidimicrobiales bacterium]|tara:strand:+ start:495 stop:1619 length:1125 start_codon:yes stop_codon:yes gene_type:complete